MTTDFSYWIPYAVLEQCSEYKGMTFEEAAKAFVKDRTPEQLEPFKGSMLPEGYKGYPLDPRRI